MKPLVYTAAAALLIGAITVIITLATWPIPFGGLNADEIADHTRDLTVGLAIGGVGVLAALLAMHAHAITNAYAVTSSRTD